MEAESSSPWCISRLVAHVLRLHKADSLGRRGHAGAAGDSLARTPGRGFDWVAGRVCRALRIQASSAETSHAANGEPQELIVAAVLRVAEAWGFRSNIVHTRHQALPRKRQRSPRKSTSASDLRIAWMVHASVAAASLYSGSPMLREEEEEDVAAGAEQRRVRHELEGALREALALLLDNPPQSEDLPLFMPMLYENSAKLCRMKQEDDGRQDAGQMDASCPAGDEEEEEELPPAGEELKPIEEAAPAGLETRPKQPKNAFLLWVDENRESLRQDLGTAFGPKIVWLGGQRWSTLSAEEKEPFEQRAAKLRQDFGEAMARFVACGGRLKGSRRCTVIPGAEQADLAAGPPSALPHEAPQGAWRLGAGAAPGEEGQGDADGLAAEEDEEAGRYPRRGRARLSTRRHLAYQSLGEVFALPRDMLRRRERYAAADGAPWRKTLSAALADYLQLAAARLGGSRSRALEQLWTPCLPPHGARWERAAGLGYQQNLPGAMMQLSSYGRCPSGIRRSQRPRGFRAVVRVFESRSRKYGPVRKTIERAMADQEALCAAHLQGGDHLTIEVLDRLWREATAALDAQICARKRSCGIKRATRASPGGAADAPTAPPPRRSRAAAPRGTPGGSGVKALEGGGFQASIRVALGEGVQMGPRRGSREEAEQDRELVTAALRSQGVVAALQALGKLFDVAGPTPSRHRNSRCPRPRTARFSLGAGDESASQLAKLSSERLKRPPSAFVLWQSEQAASLPEAVGEEKGVFGRRAAACWAALGSEEQAPYRARAAALRESFQEASGFEGWGPQRRQPGTGGQGRRLRRSPALARRSRSARFVGRRLVNRTAPPAAAAGAEEASEGSSEQQRDGPPVTAAMEGDAPPAAGKRPQRPPAPPPAAAVAAAPATPSQPAAGGSPPPAAAAGADEGPAPASRVTPSSGSGRGRGGCSVVRQDRLRGAFRQAPRNRRASSGGEKRPCTAYGLWLHENAKLLARAEETFQIHRGHAGQRAGRAWKMLGPDGQAPYVRRAAANRTAWERECEARGICIREESFCPESVATAPSAAAPEPEPPRAAAAAAGDVGSAAAP